VGLLLLTQVISGSFHFRAVNCQIESLIHILEFMQMLGGFHRSHLVASLRHKDLDFVVFDFNFDGRFVFSFAFEETYFGG
jgi:hypothetical protein